MLTSWEVLRQSLQASGCCANGGQGPSMNTCPARGGPGFSWPKAVHDVVKYHSRSRFEAAG